MSLKLYKRKDGVGPTGDLSIYNDLMHRDTVFTEKHLAKYGQDMHHFEEINISVGCEVEVKDHNASTWASRYFQVTVDAETPFITSHELPAKGVKAYHIMRLASGKVMAKNGLGQEFTVFGLRRGVWTLINGAPEKVYDKSRLRLDREQTIGCSQIDYVFEKKSNLYQYLADQAKAEENETANH